MPDHPESVLLLLSDLHFSDRPETIVGTVPRITLRALIDLPLDGQAIRMIERHCYSHDPSIVEALPSYLRELLNDLHEEGYPNSGFDLCLITGDLATFPSENAYSFLCDYLTQFEITSSSSWGAFVTSGLNLQPDILITLPGN